MQNPQSLHSMRTSLRASELRNNALEQYQGLSFQMTLADAVKHMGGNGHRPTYGFGQSWYTMSGSFIHVGFDLNKSIYREMHSQQGGSGVR